MKALDTNVVVRILLDDNKEQTKLVYDLCLSAILEQQKLFVSTLVMLELDWVLSKVYKINRQEVILMMEKLLAYDYLLIEKSDIIRSVLTFAKTNFYDLSDLLIGAIAKANDCSTTLTFDKKASQSVDFELLG